MLRKRLRPALLLLLPLLWNCSDAQPTAPYDPLFEWAVRENRSPEEELDAVREAIYRQLFVDVGWEDAATYCLSTGEWETRADPSPALLAAFEGHLPRVVPGSECTVSYEGTFYQPTGARAQTFHVTEVRRQGFRAVAEAHHHLSGRQAEGYVCTVRDEGKDGVWEVTRCVLRWAA